MPWLYVSVVVMWYPLGSCCPSDGGKTGVSSDHAVTEAIPDISITFTINRVFLSVLNPSMWHVPFQSIGRARLVHFYLLCTGIKRWIKRASFYFLVFTSRDGKKCSVSNHTVHLSELKYWNGVILTEIKSKVCNFWLHIPFFEKLSRLLPQHLVCVLLGFFL